MQREGERQGQRAPEGEAEREEERLNLEGDDDPDRKKHLERGSGGQERDGSCSQTLKWREDEDAGQDEEREKSSHTRGFERCSAFQNYSQYSFKQKEPGL